MKTNTHHKKLGCLALATALSICPATAIDIPLADDAGVFQSASGATVNTNGLNYGRRTDFIVSSTSNAARWGYLRFDVGSFLPAGTKADEVGKAVLRLWPSAVTTPGRIAVHKVVSSSWSEGTKNGVAPGAENSITFNTRPEAAVTESTFPVSPTWLGMINITATNADEFLTIDVTELVRLWVSDATTNKGILLKPQTGATSEYPLLPIHITFDTKENTTTSKQPALEVALVKKRTTAADGALKEHGDLSMGTFTNPAP